MGITPPKVMIAGIGAYVPERVLTNFELEKMVDTSDEWIRTRTGVLERRIVEDGVLNADISANAAEEAIADAGIKPEDVDVIILATITQDVKFPATACYVQDKIGAVNAYAMDISAACSGFLFALEVGCGLLTNPNNQNILIIGGEVLSSMIDWEDRETCILFGDGAGAAILQRSEGERGVLSTYLGSNGALAELLHCPGGGVKFPGHKTPQENGVFFLKMKGREVFRHAVKAMSDAAGKVLQAAGMTGDDIDLVIPHQANVRIIQGVAERHNIPMERVYVNVDRYGNTSAASIPIAMREAYQNGRLHKGDIVLMVAFGGGFTWGSSIVRF